MSPRKTDDERIDGLEPVERAWRELGDETPPELVDQAVLNRARRAVETPRRAWTFNLTWVHGLATMGVAALALTLFLQLRDEVPRAPDPALFEVPLQKAADDRKDEDAAVGALHERRQNTGAERAAQPAAAPPVPENETAEPLADRPGEQAAEGQEADALEADAESLDQIIVTGNRARDVAAKQAAAPEESFRRAEPAPQTDELLEAPVYPSLSTLAEAAWPEDPDAVSETLCRELTVAENSTVPARAECESLSFAEALFEQMRNLKERGETDRYRALLEQFRAHYPDYEIPEDLAE